MTGPARVALVLAAVTPFALNVAWHVAVARKVAHSELISRGSVLETAEIARESGLRPPCYVLGSRGATFGYALNCQTGPTGRRRNLRNRAEALRRIRAGERLAIFWGARLPSGAFAESWERVPAGRWYMYVPPGAPWFRQPG